VEEERVRSALEIAMERISALPGLTPEDIAAQKEKEFGPKGEAIAARYMSGLLTDEDLAAELDKHRTDQWQIVRRALISSLCQTLQLDGDLVSAGKALSGLRRIATPKTSVIGKAASDYQSIVHEFDREKRKQSVEIEATALQPLGISGTAVRCNLSENAHWLEELKELRRAYEPKLERLRDALLKELQAS
jgi:hypothetical protein